MTLRCRCLILYTYCVPAVLSGGFAFIKYEINFIQVQCTYVMYVSANLCSILVYTLYFMILHKLVYA